MESAELLLSSPLSLSLSLSWLRGGGGGTVRRVVTMAGDKHDELSRSRNGLQFGEVSVSWQAVLCRRESWMILASLPVSEEGRGQERVLGCWCLSRLAGMGVGPTYFSESDTIGRPGS